MAVGSVPTPRLLNELDFKVIEEKWSTIKVADGTTIRFKPVLVRVFDTDVQDKATGETIYVYEGHIVVAVRSPENLHGPPSDSMPTPTEALKMPKEEVEIIEMIDPSWNWYELENGKRIKSKPVITHIFKIKDIYDRYKNPYYVVRSQMVTGSSPLRVQEFEPSAQILGERWPRLPSFQYENYFWWETNNLSDITLGNLPPDFTKPLNILQDQWIKEKTLSIDMIFEEIYEITRGRLKGWKEEEHLADKLLFRLFKGRE